MIDGGIKGSVEVVQEVHDLHGFAVGRYCCEADDVAEVDGNFFELFRGDGETGLEGLRHGAAHGRRDSASGPPPRTNCGAAEALQKRSLHSLKEGVTLNEMAQLSGTGPRNVNSVPLRTKGFTTRYVPLKKKRTDNRKQDQPD